MRVLLAGAPLDDPEVYDQSIPNLGLYLLASIVMKHGHEVEVLDQSQFTGKLGDLESAREEVRGFDVVGISATTASWPHARRLAYDLDGMEERPFLVLGGAHGSILDEHVILSSPFDFVVRGEGERTFVSLLDLINKREDARELPGITYKKKGRAVRTENSRLLTSEEMETLPLPAYGLMPRGHYDRIAVESSRGCYNACVFCSIPYARKWRGIGASCFIKRMEDLSSHVENSRTGSFYIIDDCFTADTERVRKVAEELSAFPHPFNCEARVPDMLEDGVARALAVTPLSVVEMGVECGYDEGLEKVGKRIKISDVDRVAEVVNDVGLAERARFSFVLGLPWEGKKEVMKTIEYAMKLGERTGASIIFSWLTVYPGSRIWNKRDEWGIKISPETYDTPGWYNSEELFRHCHPKIDPDTDGVEIATYAKMLMKVMPGLKVEGALQYLMEEDG